MKRIIFDKLKESIEIKDRFIRNSIDLILESVDMISACLVSGHKLLIFGNGGSAADAQHMAAEFINRFQMDRSPLAAIALTTDTSIITSIGNDHSFDEIFSKQIKAIGKKDDIAIAISTSGNSKNVLQGVYQAKDIGIHTIGLTGSGSILAEYVDLAFCVDSGITPRIQEAHQALEHILCDLVERSLFSNPTG